MFKCCNVEYKKSDLQTYWCIETYKVKPIIKRFVNSNRVVTEVVETCICKKCGIQQLQIKRFGKKKNKKIILEVEEMRGAEADQWLIDNQKSLQIQAQICPMPLLANSTSIPAVYGYALNGTTQRARYDAALPEKDHWRNKWENGKWIPELFKSECKVIGRYE